MSVRRAEPAFATDCRKMMGCPKCIAGVMSGQIPVKRIVVYQKTNVVRLEMVDGEVTFGGVEVDVRDFESTTVQSPLVKVLREIRGEKT